MADPTEVAARPPALGRVLGQVERQVARRLEAVLAGDGLSVDQWRAVDLLSDGAGRPMSTLAAVIMVPGPTLTKIMDRLVDGALVYRLVDERDRRRVLAYLSAEGRTLHARLAPRVAEAEAAALAGLGDDAATLLTLLDRLAREPDPATGALSRPR